ncbi:PAS domain S-box protein [candidate division GN15 bacterium]|nr:PAS domain S-box protein [candidate division GN15 bacterium]
MAQQPDGRGPTLYISDDEQDRAFELLLSALEAYDDMVYIVDTKLRLVLFNEPFKVVAGAYGVAAEEMFGRPLTDFADQARELAEGVIPELKQVLSAGDRIVKRRCVGLGERQIWLETTKVPMRREGQITHVLSVARDVTRLYAAEAALDESESRYASLLNNLPVGIFRSTPDGQLLSANPAMARIYGFDSVDDMLAQKAGQTYVDPKQREEVMERLKRDGSVTGVVSRHRRHDGSEIWVSSSMHGVTDDSGNVLYFDGVDEDITDRVRAEEALRESEQLMRAMAEHSPFGISVRNRYGKLLFHNDAWLRIWAIQPENLSDYLQRERTSLKFDERDDYLGQWRPEVQRIYERGGYLHVPEVSEVRDDRTIWLSQHFYALTDGRGEVERVVIITEDITERVEARRALRESEEMNRLLVENAPAAVAVVDYEGHFIFINSLGARAHNRPVDDVVGKTMWELFPPEAAEFQMTNIRRVIDTEEGYSEEIRTRIADEWRWYDVTLQPFRNARGDVTATMVITADITQRKEAEEMMREARDILERRVAERTAQLAEANQQLRVEQETLQQKNIALQEVLGQIEHARRELAEQIQANVNRIAMPILEALHNKPPQAAEHYIGLLQECLADITSPFISRLDAQPVNLSPRELQICNMIRSGLSSKQIASTLATSVQTVNKQRNVIRKKLGISNRKVNLTSYLRRLESPQLPSDSQQ